MADGFTWGTVIAAIALGGTIVNAFASWSTWSASGERMQIEVRRDLGAPIKRIGFIGGTEAEIRLDGSLTTIWDVYAINTSRVITIPITDFALADRQFNGDYQPLVNNNLAPSPGLAIAYADGKPFLLPVSVPPGSILHLQVHSGFNVSIKAYPNTLPNGVPGREGFEFHELEGADGLDLFGNTSAIAYPGVLYTNDRKPRAPCLAVALRTGSGDIFNGQGHFYAEISVRNVIYPQRACQDARIDRPWESVAPFITRILTAW